MTGWDIVLDLLKKLSALEGESSPSNLEEWYRQRHAEEPSYPKLLGALAPTAAERQKLLEHYFEPTPEEREQGIKIPTKAHEAIAELVLLGYIKVIVTTNFDRLMKTALQARGITPEVVSTTDSIKGMTPLPHNRCLVIKVHGDYKDIRIKNSFDELATYDGALDALLDSIFDEFGLVVCGWSAKWDNALVQALKRCPTHRYMTYWIARSPIPSESEAQRLVAHRRAAVVSGAADQAFLQLADSIAGLIAIDRPHPISAVLAAATVKKYLPDPQQRIRLHDFVHDALEDLVVHQYHVIGFLQLFQRSVQQSTS